MPSYTLNIEALGLYSSDITSLEIWADGSLNSTYAISSSGSSISISISYGGSLPTSLALKFNDGLGEGGRSIQIQSVTVNNRHINTNNFLSADSLTHGSSATVDITGAAFLFDSTEPSAGEFSATTATLTSGNDDYRNSNGADHVISAGAGRDVVTLGAGDDKVNGGGGNDIIRGEAGNDLLFGEDGDDRVYGGTGNDRIYGGNGNDNLYGEDGDDFIYGGTGDDNLVGHDGNDVLIGGTGSDKLNSGAGDDYLFGDSEDDQLVGGAGNDSLDGGSGNDIIFGGSGNDIMDGGDGNDTMVGDSGNDIMNGGNGNDYMMGLDDADTITGGSGNDYISGGNGVDILDGGDDTDTLIGGQGNDIIYGGAGDDSIFGDSFSYDHPDLLSLFRFDEGSGTTDTDVISGTQNATLSGAVSWIDNDRPDGGRALYFNGGAGYDHARVNLDAMTIGGSVTFAVWARFDNLNVGGEGWQRLFDFGNGQSNEQIIMSQVGNGTDLAFGLDDSDGLSTVVAQDAIVEGEWAFWTGTISDSGVYTIYKNGIELASADLGRVPDTIVRNNNYIGDSNYAIDATFTGAMSDFSIHTSNLSHEEIVNLYINATGGFENIGPEAALVGSDTIYGGDGNDTIYGGDSDDTINGDAGDDLILGGNGNDVINGGADNDLIYGQAGDDVISGGTGNNILSGGAGSDQIDGDTGNDILYGDSQQTIVTDEDFETGAFGWSDNTTDGSDPDFTEFLGRVAGNGSSAQALSKTFALDGTQNTATIKFDAYFIDAWINEDFIIYINDAVAIRQEYLVYDDINENTGSFAGGVWERTLINEGALGFANWDSTSDDHLYQYTLHLENYTSTSIKLGFGFTSIETTFYESYGIDNVLITTGTESGDAADTINGDAGEDLIYGGGGNDIINGGADNDTIYGENGNDTLDGGSGSDLIFGGMGDDTINGGNNTDTLFGGSGNDTINGGSGNDILDGGIGSDTLDGGNGNDIIHAADVTTSNIVESHFSSGLEGYVYQDDMFLGTSQPGYASGSRVTWIGDHADGALAVVLGGVNGSGISNMSGGFEKTFTTTEDMTNVTIRFSYHVFNSGGNAFESGENVYLYATMDGAYQSEIGQDYFRTIWNPGAAYSQGWYGFGVEYGYLEAGTHTFDLGAYLTAKNNAGEELSIIFDDIYIKGDSVGDVGVSNEVYGGAGDDILHGGSGDDEIHGNDGNDTLYGYGGDDIMDGWIGDDIIYGGAGNDTIYGDYGDDIIYGGDGDDIIYAQQDDDIIHGGAGNNTIYGGDGNDIIYGIDASDSQNSEAESNGGVLYQSTTTFDSNLDGYGYYGDYFWDHGGNTSYTSGGWIGTDGNSANGAVQIVLGGVNNTAYSNMAGGIDTTYTKISATSEISVTYSYRMIHGQDFDNGEFLNQWYSLDYGTAIDQHTLTGNGNGGGDMDTGWLTFTVNFGVIAAGNHDLSLGGFVNYKNSTTEQSRILYDDIIWTESEPGAAAPVATANSTQISGGDGADVLYGSTQTDHFIFESASAFNNVDQIENFNMPQQDAIDLSDVLSGFNSGTDDISDFVRMTTSGSNTLIQVDVNGAAGGANFTTIGQINDLVGLNAASMYADGTLIA